MSFSERLKEIRTGFEPAFWVANGTELFERLAFYGQQASLSVFLVEALHFSPVAKGNLMGWFGLAVYALPVLVGTLADRFGFRRSLAFAYLIATAGYFLLGSMSAPWMAPLHKQLSPYWLVFAILMLTALGPAFVKPCVVGTIAKASQERVRSMGYSIYYTIVNLGGALGPVIAGVVHLKWGLESVFRVSSLSVFLMFLAVLLFYREPAIGEAHQVASVGRAFKNVFLVFGNWRFMLFMVIYSGLWVMFYAFFVLMPDYIHDYVNPKAVIEPILSADAWAIFAFQWLVTYLTRKILPFPAIIVGVVLASFSMLTVISYPSTWAVVAAMVVFSLGEMTQAPRYYEYVSRLAPPGQQGLFMGFAFLPIAIGYLIAGRAGGHLLHYFGEELHRPTWMWWFLAGLGFLTALLLWIYNLIWKPGQSGPAETEQPRPTS